MTDHTVTLAREVLERSACWEGETDTLVKLSRFKLEAEAIALHAPTLARAYLALVERLREADGALVFLDTQPAMASVYHPEPVRGAITAARAREQERKALRDGEEKISGGCFASRGASLRRQ